MARIDAFLKLGVAQGCSDLHLAVGVPPMLRMHGDLMPIKFRDLGEAELESYITEVLTQSQLKVLREGNDLDFSYVSAEGGRFRVNVFRKETGIGAAFRAIPTAMPSMDQLGLPPVVKKLCDYHQGMILVTGSTGTGKTTTLASMIDYLNSTRALNIISLEDPIEFVHRSKTSQVIQRELGTHLPTFAEGVRAAMREDPDVILVGEMRDAETIAMAIMALYSGNPYALVALSAMTQMQNGANGGGYGANGMMGGGMMSGHDKDKGGDKGGNGNAMTGPGGAMSGGGSMMGPSGNKGSGNGSGSNNSSGSNNGSGDKPKHKSHGDNGNGN